MPLGDPSKVFEAPKSPLVKLVWPMTRWAACPVLNTGVWPDADTATHTHASTACKVRAQNDFIFRRSPLELAIESLESFASIARTFDGLPLSDGFGNIGLVNSRHGRNRTGN